MKCALKFSCKGTPNVFLLKVNYLDEIIKTLMKNDRPLSDVKKNKYNIIKYLRSRNFCAQNKLLVSRIFATFAKLNVCQINVFPQFANINVIFV